MSEGIFWAAPDTEILLNEVSMEITSLYRKAVQVLDGLKPVQKYIAFTLIFLALGLVVNLVTNYFRGLQATPANWWMPALVWTAIGVGSAFGSEQRRKNAKPEAPVTTDTRT